MPPIPDHPLRYALANELHARPFPSVGVPATAVYLAVKQPVDAAKRDRDADRAHLLSLLDRYGAPHPQPDATHYFGDLGKYALKWESHTEFVTYTALRDGVSSRPFDPLDFEVFPEDWLQEATRTARHLGPDPRDALGQRRSVAAGHFGLVRARKRRRVACA